MNEVRTKNGHNLFEISSLIQKALRRGDKEFAAYAANEMERDFRPYLWKRLFVVSAEDCFDMVSHQILQLKELDDKEKNNEYISYAVALLTETRKNRDADFFACNLLYSRYKKDYPCGGEIQTRHGHDVKKLADILTQKLLQGDDVEVGYLANEIRQWYRGLFWVCAKNAASQLGFSDVEEEVNALEQIDILNMKTKNNTTIYICKAITTIFKAAKYGNGIFQTITPQPLNIEDYGAFRKIPRYCYDVHTWQGKRMGKTDDDFIIEEQQSLHPHQQGEYDDRDWANSRKWRTEGRHHDFNTPKLPKKVLADVNKGKFQPTLF